MLIFWLLKHLHIRSIALWAWNIVKTPRNNIHLSFIFSLNWLECHRNQNFNPDFHVKKVDHLFYFCLSLAKISGLNFCAYPTFFCVRLARVFFPGRRFSKLESPLWQYIVDTVWDLYHSLDICKKIKINWLGIKPNFVYSSVIS